MATHALIVADDANTRITVFDILRTNGYQTDTVTTAADAIQRVELTKYNLIIIDWHLPDGTAIQWLPLLSSLATHASIVIATGASDMQYAIQSLQYGACDYIVKPVCPELLLGSIERAKMLQAAQQRAIQSERLAAIGTAVAAVAHESRNALQRIRASVDLIRLMHEDDTSLLQDLSLIEDASVQLQSQFEELRQFTASLDLQKVRSSLRDLLQRVWHDVQLASGLPAIQLCLPKHDVQWILDPHRFKQVMRNLFENAIEASKTATHVQVTWTTNGVNGTEILLLTVKDHGPGFTQRERKSAFEPFFTTKRHGTGLGLPICRRIIEAHGGSISIAENLGNGAAITLSLPQVGQNEARHALQREEAIN